MTSKFSQILSIFLFLAAIPAFAGDSTKGGASAVGGRLTSHAENDGTVMFFNNTNLTKATVILQNEVQSVLNNVRKTVPGFLPILTEAFKTKVWYLEPKPLVNCPDDGSLTELHSKVVACQNDIDIRISMKWFEDEAENDVARATVIVHELIRNLYLKSLSTSKPISPSAVHALDRLLFQNPFLEPKTLQARLSQYGFGEFEVSESNGDNLSPDFASLFPKPGSQVIPVADVDETQVKPQSLRFTTIASGFSVQMEIDGRMRLIFQGSVNFATQLNRLVYLARIHQLGTVPVNLKLLRTDNHNILGFEKLSDDERARLAIRLPDSLPGMEESPHKILIHPLKLEIGTAYDRGMSDLYVAYDDLSLFSCSVNAGQRHVSAQIISPLMSRIEALKGFAQPKLAYFDFSQLAKICDLKPRDEIFERDAVEIRNNVPFVIYPTTLEAP